MHFFETALGHFGTSHILQLGFVVWSLVALALLFDFLNGLHDASNSIATIVSTRILSPRSAVIWAAVFNFIAFLVFAPKVAGTIEGDVVDSAIVDNRLIAATLLAACAWNVLTWYLGLPVSSSHALVGGMVGAALAKTGDVTVLRGGFFWIIAFIALAPLIGWFLGTAIAVTVTWACRPLSPQRVDAIFRRGQLLSAAFFSLGHGGNDAQKTMGIIWVLINAACRTRGLEPPGVVPTEVVLACHAAMGLGTLSGGWRIVKTMGQRIIRIRPVDGFCAEGAAALTLAATTSIGGIPISTTHTIMGALIGVGSLKRVSAVRWSVAGRVVWAWILTIPGAALAAAIAWHLANLIFGTG
jgi:PiT family inorganic phosphate transporter